jgi:hypothetical protein
MEHVLNQLGAAVFDFISVTKRTRDYQSETIHDALIAMTTAAQVVPSRVI